MAKKYSTFTITAAVGPKDTIKASTTHDPKSEGILSFFGHPGDAIVSTDKLMDAIKRLGLKPSETAMDLLVIACSLATADTRVDRAKNGADGWTRLLRLKVPVREISLWNSQQQLLEEIFRFLTGDIWTVEFRAREGENLFVPPSGRQKQYQLPYESSTACLFSGGLDSFIGAIDLLESGIRPILVSHSKSADVSTFQTKCHENLLKHYQVNAPSLLHAFIGIPKKNLFDSEDHTERGRSFLFFSLGALCASSLNQNSVLIVPENGMISLNLPLSPLRIGSHSTRTTHPYYMGLMLKLFNNLGIGVRIENPYQLATKGEMISSCKNTQILLQENTMSCSHPNARYDGLGNIHCGYCVPCIIRQSAYLNSNVTDPTKYKINLFDHSLDINHVEGNDAFAFKYMITRSQNDPNFLLASIRSTGKLEGDVAKYVDVYKRGLDEVSHLLQKVTFHN